jgi:hypothetical protein
MLNHHPGYLRAKAGNFVRCSGDFGGLSYDDAEDDFGQSRKRTR